MKPRLNVAIIDLYNNEENEGMRCIKEIVSDLNLAKDNPQVEYQVFGSRYSGSVPSIDFDIYISSGGPGSPFEDEGKNWEKDYFNLVDKIYSHNQNHDSKKFLFFICHSFQLMARHFKFAEVNERYRKSFGILPFHKTLEGENDPILASLPNPFFAADFRLYQVVNEDQKVIRDLDAKILSYEIVEENETHTPALTAVRISDEIAGTQFHPEADPASMIYHFKQPERKEHIIKYYNEERYEQMLKWLDDEEKIRLTRKTVLPKFLQLAVDELTLVYS